LGTVDGVLGTVDDVGSCFSVVDVCRVVDV
jgi:hypothetical protein